MRNLHEDDRAHLLLIADGNEGVTPDQFAQALFMQKFLDADRFEVVPICDDVIYNQALAITVERLNGDGGQCRVVDSKRAIVRRRLPGPSQHTGHSEAEFWDTCHLRVVLVQSLH